MYEDIFLGGMPKLRSTDLDRDRFYMDYINTYIERDIKDLAQVGKLNEFYDFLVYMAARTGQELKYDEIASTIGVSAPTAKSWVSILERSGIIIPPAALLLQHTKRLVKTPQGVLHGHRPRRLSLPLAHCGNAGEWCDGRSLL